MSYLGGDCDLGSGDGRIVIVHRITSELEAVVMTGQRYAIELDLLAVFLAGDRRRWLDGERKFLAQNMLQMLEGHFPFRGIMM